MKEILAGSPDRLNASVRIALEEWESVVCFVQMFSDKQR